MNPKAGRGQGGRTQAALEHALNGALKKVTFVQTQHRGHATELAREAAQRGIPCIIAVGGDGTMSEVAAGVVQSQRNDTAVALIHQGTGGDFKRSLNVPQRLDLLCQAIAREQVRSVDVLSLRYTNLQGDVRERLGINVVSLGMGGLVDDAVQKLPLGMSGKAAYFVAALHSLAVGVAAKVRCDLLEGDEHTRMQLQTRALMLCNGGYFGGGMHIAPNAVVDDGHLNMVALTGSSRMDVLRLSQAIYQGDHLTARNVVHARAQEVRVEVHAEYASLFPLDVDGEGLGAVTHLRARVLPSALRVVG